MRPSLSNRKAEGLSKAKSESFCALEALTSLAVRDLEKLYGMVVRYVSSGMLDMVKRISYIQHETPQCGGGLQYLHYLVVWLSVIMHTCDRFQDLLQIPAYSLSGRP